MCGFIFAVSRKQPSGQALQRANAHIGKRGPDYSGHYALELPGGGWFTLSHSLLDISGHAVRQPLSLPESPGLHLLFNGEIYNYREFSARPSDTEGLFDAHRAFGGDLPRHLRGEYVILMVDAGQRSLRVFTDPFMTKPVFIGKSDNPAEIAFASYPSALVELGYHHVQIAEPNSRYTVHADTRTLRFEQEFPALEFACDQTVGSYDRFFDCLVEAVRLRASHGAAQPALSLSSGYDSGAVCCALNLLKLPYTTVSVDSGENPAVMARRLAINAALGVPHIAIPPIGKARARALGEEIEREVQPFSYVHADQPGTRRGLGSDPGAMGAFLVAGKLRELGIKVNLSGSGADEIYSDYGHAGTRFYPHSEFGGAFPDDLESLFPWRKFYGDTQRSYLFKEEIIFGHFGIESRYPLLDQELVREFLALVPSLKNAEYKAPLAAFMRRHDYPFAAAEKRGFSVRQPSLGRRVRRRIRDLLGGAGSAGA